MHLAEVNWLLDTYGNLSMSRVQNFLKTESVKCLKFLYSLE